MEIFFGKSSVSFRQTGQSWEVFVSTSVEDQEAVIGRLPSLPGLTAGSTAFAQASNGQSGHHEVSEKASGDGQSVQGGVPAASRTLLARPSTCPSSGPDALLHSPNGTSEAMISLK